jgi:hypothetical protein
MTPAVQLIQPNIVWLGALNGSAIDEDDEDEDDGESPRNLAVTLPFNVTLYNTTTNKIYTETEGVSLFKYRRIGDHK